MSNSIAIPPEVAGVLERHYTAEFATRARDRTPIAVPVAPLWLPERGAILVSTGIGFPYKAFNARRDPKVSLLYSNPTAGGLDDPPVVLVQGNAVVSEIVTWDEELERQWRKVWAQSPKGIAGDAITRRVFWWYYMRLKITVEPVRIRWWPGRDMTAVPHESALPGYENVTHADGPPHPAGSPFADAPPPHPAGSPFADGPPPHPNAPHPPGGRPHPGPPPHPQHPERPEGAR
ncbi:pyridoxamine 5'-phosphate oxidase family protein [Nocardia sp. NPDC005978]|uniref:pyridoxamine 5'-phosphate oxidase family protein n=1 Tax=unclassified Nocardia TaxID=2637762 RepID=UPI0033A2DBE2